MGLELRWVGDDELDRVADVRAQSFGHAQKDLKAFRERIRKDPRQRAGDYLLAEWGGEAIGTTTALSMTMWVRGARLACQGVAYVGTSKTHRRGCGAAGAGVASRLMQETVRKAREREEVLTALMPFRVSFYEHFGYGIVERRTSWTIPTAILPADPVDGFTIAESVEDPAIGAARQRMTEAGQCDVERGAAGQAAYAGWGDDAFVYIDRADDATSGGGSHCICQRQERDGKGVLAVNDWSAASPRAFGRLLRFLASQRDQYPLTTIELPVDCQLHRVLSEHHLVQRPWNHPAAACAVWSRMMLRVLDHGRLLAAMRLPEHARGDVVVAIHESEGGVSKLRLSFEAGRCVAKPTDASADVTCDDKTWAAIACGELKASEALQLGVTEATGPEHARRLDVFADGPRPFCQEYF